MSLKQFPSHGAFSAARDRYTKAITPDQEEPPPRVVATVFDVQDAWEMVELKRAHHQSEGGTIEGLAALGRQDAAKIAAAAGLKIDANFTIAQAVEKFRKRKVKEIQFYVVFLVLFTTVTLLNLDPWHGSILRSTIEDGVTRVKFRTNTYKSLDNITTESDFWDFMGQAIPHVLFNDNYHDPQTLNAYQGQGNSSNLLYAFNYNRIMQPVRLRQIKVEELPLADCQVALVFDNPKIECWPAYADGFPNKTDLPGYPPNGKVQYQTELETLIAPYGRGTTTTYLGDGFPLDIPLLSSKESYTELLEHLKTSQFIDKGTRAVFMDIALFNPPTRFFVSVRISFEFMPYGDVRPSQSVRLFKIPVADALSDTILSLLDQIVYLFVLMFVIYDVWRIRSLGWNIHFKNPFNVLNIANFVLFMMTFSAKSSFNSLPVIIAMGSEVEDTATTTDAPYFDFEEAGAAYNQIQSLTAFNALICWLKLMEYLKYFSFDLSVLTNTIAKCTVESSSWFLMVFLILFAYGQAFYLAFGPEVNGFDSFSQALATMCVWTFNVIDFNAVLSSDQVLASLLFVSFQIIYSILLVNMFIVILIRSYKDIKEAMVQGDDPIAAEIRKWVRVWAKRQMERAYRWLPAFSLPGQDELDDEDLLEAHGQYGAEKETDTVADKMKKKQMLELNDLKVTLQQVHLVHLEIQFLADRVEETAKKQASLNRDDSHDGMEHLLEDQGPTIAKSSGHPMMRTESAASVPRGPPALTITGGQFGKIPSRPTSSSTLSTRSSTPVRFGDYKNLGLMWMPPSIASRSHSGNEPIGIADVD